MMSKRSNKRIIAGMLLLALLSPETSFAASGRSARPAASTTAAKANFCSAVASFAEKLKADMGGKEASYSAKDAERQNQLAEKLAKQEAERQNVRFSWDSSRDKVYTTLATKAKTQKEKDALLEFRKAIDAAVEARRASVDRAVGDFKTKVDESMLARKRAVEEAIAEFNASADLALSLANTDCKNGVASATARATYLASLERARLALEADLASIKSGERLRTLVKERQSAIEAAAREFKTAVGKAEERLKSAFPDA